MTTLIILIFLLIGGILLLPTIRTLVDKLTKTQQQREQEAQEKKRFDDEGFFLALQRYFLGNNLVDNTKSKKLNDIFIKNAKDKKERDAKNKGFKNVADYEKATDPNRISANNITKFNPKGIIGFGILSINNGKDLKDTPQNRKRILSLTMTVPRTKSFRKGRRDNGIF